jgi:HlyD family secretion protein
VEASVANTRAGTVEACERAKMAPPTGGQVASIAVREGDRVRTGQLLLSLWNEDRKAELKLAESELVASRAKTEEVCALAESAEREAQRLLKLQKSRLVAEDQIDKAMADAEARKAACRAGHAAEQQSLARIDVARAALERTILRAPFAGVVAEVNAKLGEYVTPSPPGIPTLPAIDLVGEQCLYVSAPIDEVDAPAIRPGQTTRITLDAFAGRDFKGEVRRVAPYVLDLEKQARTVEVEATFTDFAETANLLPGYSADIEVILDSRPQVLRVPTEAVLEGYRVLVFQPDTQRLEERRFKPGLANWKYTEVLEGLREGELIVVSVAREGVTAGARVNPEVQPSRTSGTP